MRKVNFMHVQQCRRAPTESNRRTTSCLSSNHHPAVTYVPEQRSSGRFRVSCLQYCSTSKTAWACWMRPSHEHAYYEQERCHIGCQQVVKTCGYPRSPNGITSSSCMKMKATCEAFVIGYCGRSNGPCQLMSGLHDPFDE